MIRIVITAEAFDAAAPTLPLGAVCQMEITPSPFPTDMPRQTRVWSALTP
jgi:hypothetical protein